MENLNPSTKNNKRNYKITLRFKKLITWLITFVFSLILIIGFNSYFSSKLDMFNIEGAYSERARVTELKDYTSDSYDTGGDSSYESSYQYFNAKILSGEFKGETVLAVQSFDNLTGINEDKVEVGDKIILYNYGYAEGDAEWIFGTYSRLDVLIVFGCIFVLALLIFGQIKGFNTIVALVFTCLAVFSVFIPAVLCGVNMYFATLAICIYIIPMTLLITEGPTYKSFTTIIGCTSGVLVAALLTVILDKLMGLTGLLDEHTLYLTYFDPPINLHGVIFSMVVIGAMGAVMDVAMDISASLHEIHVKLPGLGLKDLYKSGITIGRDVMGTMANTLVLAYIGSSLCSILLMISYSTNLIELLNRESLIVEMMNGLIGSTAILLTIPLTSIICAIIYRNHHKH